MSKAVPTGGPRAARRQERVERLAAALKANLHRRKAQSRERAAEAGEPGHRSEQATATAPCDEAPIEARPLKTPPDQETPPELGS